MAAPSCPTCTTPLEQAGFTERCATCEGAWIHEDVLVGMMQERASAIVELTWEPRPGERARPCAVCKTPMQAVSLGTVALDRCPPHGVWFDAEELASLIKQAKHFKAEPHDDPDDHPDPQRRGLFRSIAKLFGG
ncbi:MAG: zf-TFIIB domain-containing protein [Deltaproteobacteria bacterium]|nr:zf-TFIIB domain-containing protein [Deltaproteobacteria bacterium]